MKKFIALSAAALLSTSAFAVTSQTVHITGEVYGQTCEIDGNALQFVVLDKININDLKSGTDNAKEFSVNLKGCDTKSTQQVYVQFDSNSANITTDGNLKNTNTTANAGTGVQIKLLQADGTKINLKDATTAKSTGLVQRQATDGKASFKFKAGYAVEAGATPTTGLVGSSVPVSIAYQ